MKEVDKMVGDSEPTKIRDDEGNETTGGISSYAMKRSLAAEERKASIEPAGRLSKTVKDNQVKVHIKGYRSKGNPPSIIK